MLQHLNQNPNLLAKRIIVLGGNGFVGNYLNKYLKNLSVEVLSYSSKDLDLISTASVDQLNNLLKEEDAVVFLSCLTPDRGRDTATLMKNLAMADNVAKALSAKKIQQLVYASSDAVYDTSSNPINENTKPVAQDQYSYMHIGREIILKEACQKMKNPLCILRPVGMFGDGDTHNSYGPNRFSKQARDNKKIQVFGQGEELRDHLHVEDFCQVIVECLKKQSTGVLNVATGKSVSFGDVAKMIQKMNSCDLEFLPRGGEITHKHFDTTNLMKAFPQLKFKQILG